MPDLREQVLRAMGFAKCHCGSERCQDYTVPTMEPDNVSLHTWHPAASLDDVRVVEEWLIAQRHGVLLHETLEDTVHRGKVFSPYWIPPFATASERWAACVAVMREANLIGDRTDG